MQRQYRLWKREFRLTITEFVIYVLEHRTMGRLHLPG